MTTATHPPAKAAIQANTARDLRAAYLVAFEKAPVDLIAIVDTCRFNTRYAREVLGTLTQAGLLVKDEDTEIWYYNEEKFSEDGRDGTETVESAAAVVDAWLAEHGLTQPAAPPSPPKATTPRSTTATKKVKGSGVCSCGCGRSTKALFAPGHDARMAGEIARLIAEEDGDMGLLTDLPTQPLRDKARAHAERLMAKGSSKADRAKHEVSIHEVVDKVSAEFVRVPLTEDHSVEEIERRTGEPFYTYGVVKIGKNRFAARRDADGVIMRHNKALPNQVISLATYAELDYTATTEGNPAKSFKALEVQP